MDERLQRISLVLLDTISTREQASLAIRTAESGIDTNGPQGGDAASVIVQAEKTISKCKRAERVLLDRLYRNRGDGSSKSVLQVLVKMYLELDAKVINEERVVKFEPNHKGYAEDLARAREQLELARRALEAVVRA